MNNTTSSSSFICVINNKSTTKYEEGQCAVANIAATLYKYDFGYYCMGILGVIIFISIFGGIKQNYRWFILNQALWDLLKSVEFSCENYLRNYVRPSSGCFYYTNNGSGQWDVTIHQIILNNIFGPTLLLSITRFIALYYINFYDKITRGYRIIFIILLFNLVPMIMDSDYFISVYLVVPRQKWLLNECQIKQGLNSSSTSCSSKYTEDFIYNFFISLFNICSTAAFFKPAAWLFISTICTSMIILKVAKQAKFQLKHNRRDFFNSARVAVVIASQTLMNFLIFGLNFIKNFWTIVAKVTFNPHPLIVTVQTYVEGRNYTGYIDFRLPLWLDGVMGLTNIAGMQNATQTRILIESIIVLCIMTGYREAIVKIFKKVYLLITNPRKFLLSFKKVNHQRSWT